MRERAGTHGDGPHGGQGLPPIQQGGTTWQQHRHHAGRGLSGGRGQQETSHGASTNNPHAGESSASPSTQGTGGPTNAGRRRAGDGTDGGGSRRTHGPEPANQRRKGTTRARTTCRQEESSTVRRGDPDGRGRHGTTTGPHPDGGDNNTQYNHNIGTDDRRSRRCREASGSTARWERKAPWRDGRRVVQPVELTLQPALGSAGRRAGGSHHQPINGRWPIKATAGGNRTSTPMPLNCPPEGHPGLGTGTRWHCRHHECFVSR